MLDTAPALLITVSTAAEQVVHGVCVTSSDKQTLTVQTPVGIARTVFAAFLISFKVSRNFIAMPCP